MSSPQSVDITYTTQLVIVNTYNNELRLKQGGS